MQVCFKFADFSKLLQFVDFLLQNYEIRSLKAISVNFKNLFAYTNYSLKISTTVEGSKINEYLSKEIQFETKADVPRCLPKVSNHGYIRMKPNEVIIFFTVSKNTENY